MKKTLTDEKIIEMLLIHGSVQKAAAALGLSARTIYNRLKDPAVRQMYADARGQMLETATATLCDALGDAVSFLHGLVIDPDAPLGLKVQSADSLLRHCVRYSETCDVLRRISELEKRLDEAEANNE